MTVELEVDRNIATLRIDDPRHANALTSGTVDALLGALEELSTDVECVIFTGTGRFFCAGGDLEVLREWGTWEPLRRREYLQSGPHAIGRALRYSRLASIAAVNGAATGAGMDLALSCDVRVASTDARLCESYINLGVVPGDGGAWLLPRIVGLGRAMELLLSGRNLGAEEALQWGVVTAVTKPEDLLAHARQIANRLASRPARARLLTRELVLQAASQSWDEHLEHIGLLMASVAGSTEHRLALQAFIDGS